MLICAQCASFCPVRPCVALGRTTNGLVEVLSESDFNLAADKTTHLNYTTAANPYLTTCTSLAWMTDNDIRLVAAYYNPSCSCKVLLWDGIADG